MKGNVEISIDGFLGGEPAVLPLKEGQVLPTARLSVAVDRTNPKGEKETIWWAVYVQAVKDVEAFRKAFRKGRRVMVRGEPHWKVWSKDGRAPTIDCSLLADGRPKLLDAPDTGQRR